MKSGCISHPAGESIVLIRQWQIDAFGCKVVAALLSYFEYWHDIKARSVRGARHLNDVAERHGDQPQQDTSLLQYHTLEEIEKALLTVGKRTKISAGIKRLDEAGIISKHKNPNPRYSFDQTIYYQFHPEIVNEYLTARTRMVTHSSKMNDGSFRSVLSAFRNELSAYDSERSIHKTTSKTTSKTSTERKEEDSFFREELNQAEVEAQTQAGQPLPVKKQRSPQAQPNPGGEGSAAQFNSSQRMEERFNAGANPHPHPDLVRLGLGGLHQGTKKHSDWCEWAIAAARAELQITKPDSDLGIPRCKRFISNLVSNARRDNDYGRLEILLDSADILRARRAAAAAAVTNDEPKVSPFERSPEEIQSTRAAIDAAAANLPPAIRRARQARSTV